MSQYAQWDDLTSLRYDPCARAAYDRQSAAPGTYKVKTPGFRDCETQALYATHMTEPMHYQKVYRSSCVVDQESQLRHAPLTNPNFIHQQFTRPYLGAYMGAGQRSLDNKDLETELTYGLDTRGGPRKACDALAGVSIDRFECLPEFGNPQRVQHVVFPGIWGGDNTRDHARRVNYETYYKNARNNSAINKVNRTISKDRI